MYALEQESLLDKAMLRYAENLEGGAASIEGRGDHIAQFMKDAPVKQKGWALKNASTSRRRFNEKQKQYLIKLFLLGEQTGRKSDADEVSKAMRKSRNADGTLIFQSDEFLTSRQIMSFFSRLAAKKNLKGALTSQDEDDDNDDDDLHAAMAEQQLDQMCQEVMDEVSLQHPITYESFNICEMAVTSKLSKFSISMLQDICKHHDLDTSQIKQKRKKPYIDLLEGLVKSCTC